MIRKFLFLVIFLLIIAALPAFAAETFEYNNIAYSIDLVANETDSELVITALSPVNPESSTESPHTLTASLVYEILGYNEEFKDPTDISKALASLANAPITVKKSPTFKNVLVSTAVGSTDEDGIFIPPDLSEISKDASEPATEQVQSKPKAEVSVVLHGIYTFTETPVEFPDQQPVIVEGRTLVPARGVFELLGYTVDWEAETSTVIVRDGQKELKVTIGSNTLYISGKPYEIDVPAQIINGRTMIPLRFISWSFGLQIDWTEKTKTVHIYY